jgi:hypothetical protein
VGKEPRRRCVNGKNESRANAAGHGAAGETAMEFLGSLGSRGYDRLAFLSARLEK